MANNKTGKNNKKTAGKKAGKRPEQNKANKVPEQNVNNKPEKQEKTAPEKEPDVRAEKEEIKKPRKKEAGCFRKKASKKAERKEYKNVEKTEFFWNRPVLWSCILIILAFVFSYIRLSHFTEYGDITLFSMFFLYLLGYFFGGARGMVAALVFSLLKFGVDASVNQYVLNVTGRDLMLINLSQLDAEFFDYISSYTLVAAGGFFVHPFRTEDRENYAKKYSVSKKTEFRYLFTGYIIGMAFRYISSVVNFMTFYRTDIGFAGDLKEAVVYCFGYVGLEAILTVLFLLIPGVHKAAEYCKYVATHRYPFKRENI